MVLWVTYDQFGITFQNNYYTSMNNFCGIVLDTVLEYLKQKDLQRVLIKLNESFFIRN